MRPQASSASNPRQDGKDEALVQRHDRAESPAGRESGDGVFGDSGPGHSKRAGPVEREGAAPVSMRQVPRRHSSAAPLVLKERKIRLAPRFWRGPSEGVAMAEFHRARPWPGGPGHACRPSSGRRRARSAGAAVAHRRRSRRGAGLGGSDPVHRCGPAGADGRDGGASCGGGPGAHPTAGRPRRRPRGDMPRGSTAAI